jgi:ribosomal protein S18 acetylase RimI-like enzyme
MRHASIRALTTADTASFWQLRLEMLERDPFAYGSDAATHSNISMADQAERIRLLPDGDVIIGAFLDAELVGSAVLRRETSLKMRHKANVFSVYVTASARGQGLARMMMLEVIARARSLPDVVQLGIGVMTTQVAARNLYTSLGFVEWGLEPRAICVDGVFADEAYMVLNLA